MPNVFLKLGLSIAKASFVQRYIPEKDKKYVNINMLEKLSSCINILKEYKGLKIVDVQSKDGDHVSITL
jgi:hypothetical protein